MPKNLLSLGEIIEKEEDLKPLRIKVKEYDIVLQFRIIFPELKQIAEAVKVIKNVLYLKVENSVWRSELRIRQKSIVDRINSSIKEESIKSIKFI